MYVNKFIVSMWNGVNLVHKPALLKDDIVLLGFRLLHHNAIMFLLGLLRIVKMTGGASSSIISQRNKVYLF